MTLTGIMIAALMAWGISFQLLRTVLAGELSLYVYPGLAMVVLLGALLGGRMGKQIDHWETPLWRSAALGVGLAWTSVLAPTVICSALGTFVEFATSGVFTPAWIVVTTIWVSVVGAIPATLLGLAAGAWTHLQLHSNSHPTPTT